MVKITVLKRAIHEDLIKKYENPLKGGCDMTLGDVYYSNGNKPEGFCNSAWESVGPFVRRLESGENNFFDGWMKDKNSAMVSCNDGFRPVSFYVEKI